jgi:hypothetical protein
MIDVIKYDDGLPVSVIIPHGRTKIRDSFFDNYVFPLLEANEPLEIIINDNAGRAPKKRNDGFDKSTQPFIYFCDNDVLLPKNHIKTLYETLLNNPNKAYAYSGYYGIVQDPTTHPLKNNFKIPTLPFNGERLKQGNYISTMSLIRRECLPKQPRPFDENLKRLMDWDLYLTMLSNGHEGIAVNDIEYMAYYLDEGITSNNNNEREGLMAVVQKHKLI